MSTGEMKITDILKYAVKIEHESMLFYKEAASRIPDPVIKELLEILEAEEVKHETRLSKLLADADDTALTDFDPESLEKLIRNSMIANEASEKDILETALGREKNTRDFYARITTMTNLAADVTDLFQMLYDQESGHVTRVNNMLQRID